MPQYGGTNCANTDSNSTAPSTRTIPTPARRGPALDMRNNIVMSHVKLGPYPVGSGDAHAYNRDLYEIACEVERNNFDFFISVHSNAHTDGSNTNYPALFVRGENRTASVEGPTMPAACSGRSHSRTNTRLGAPTP